MEDLLDRTPTIMSDQLRNQNLMLQDSPMQNQASQQPSRSIPIPDTGPTFADPNCENAYQNLTSKGGDPGEAQTIILDQIARVAEEADMKAQ